MSTAVIALLVALAAPALLLALTLAVAAALPGLRPHLHVRPPRALREPVDLAAARATVEHRAPEWAQALHS
ncbi:hypothetical protein SAMN06264364_10392 [Quadrisphaera granulorum]|uniref:Uncharacterized protein n=1 Tax=Quadrisphaera granulorum TaxID=317664 RepID=A0A316ACV8_9ACTN|nr:hypothetical protein [Quadrisphaera granulorum]PWJ55422.1 hypothetical protein BXY45_10392 [Quadrisphaera granulorum]SZE95486.1 hypothetical protein SAMN06264364_10392 [Quadrisphaera granulorum]